MNRKSRKTIGLLSHGRTLLRPSKTSPSSDEEKLVIGAEDLFGSKEALMEALGQEKRHYFAIATQLDSFPKYKQKINDLESPALNAEEYDKEYVRVQLGQYENGTFSRVFPRNFYLSRGDIFDTLSIEDMGIGLDSTWILDGEVIKRGANYNE